MPLPEITPTTPTSPTAPTPYLLASLYDNECAAVAVINRNINGQYQQQRVDITARPLRWDRKVGIFGFCHTITLRYQRGLPAGSFAIYAQDLASDGAPRPSPIRSPPTAKASSFVEPTSKHSARVTATHIVRWYARPIRTTPTSLTQP